MARMLKLAIAPSGTLVYRSTGKAYQGTATVKNGRVYGKTGRMIGYIGKPTKTQSKEISRLDKRRVAERRRQKLNRKLETLEYEYQAYGASSGKPGEVPPTWGVYTRRRLTEINFGHFLSEVVKAGKMSQKEARDRLEKYLKTETSAERTAQWDELKGRFKEMGFPYP